MTTRATILEVVQRCRYCSREMQVSSQSFVENPYCRRCLKERVQKEAGSGGGTWLPAGPNKMRVRTP